MINSPTEEIKAKIDIVDLISEYVQLKPAGTNWKANCPFHNEKTPSFMASREKQIWHCFGCGEGGDAFSFVQKIENVDFAEALKILAQKAGVKLGKLDPTLVSQKTIILDILRLSAEFFHKALLQSLEAKIARNYLDLRQLQNETIINFYLGYAPNSWDKLLALLQKKGFKDKDIALTGLVVKNEQGKVYDRFRERLMFPIADHNGNIVGFTGRILDETKDNQGGKYVNTPQTLVYNKSYVLYGLDKAKQAIKRDNLAVIVEGNMDVIASHQAGVTNVIASSGTALTLEQLKILQRYTNNLAIAFDMDLAGQVAAERGIDTALSLGLNIKVIQLPEQISGHKIKDPDDCIKYAPQEWATAIKQAVSIMDFYFTKVFQQFDKNNPQDKKEIAAKLLKQIAKLADKVEQESWVNQLAQRLDVSESILHETFNKFLEKKEHPKQEIKFIETGSKSREDLLAEQLLALVIKYPQNLSYVIDRLDKEMILANDLKTIYTELVLYYNKKEDFSNTELEKILLAKNPVLVNKLTTLTLLADKDFFDFTADKIQQEIVKLTQEIKKHYINLKLKQIQKLLMEAEKNHEQKQIEQLTSEFSYLNQQLNNIN